MLICVCKQAQQHTNGLIQYKIIGKWVKNIQQIISDFEREQFQLKDATKDLELLNTKKNHLNEEQGINEIDSEKIDSLKEEKDQLKNQTSQKFL